jgi:hypothetical protein
MQGTGLPFLREIDCRLQPPIPRMERGLFATWGAISASSPMPLVPLYLYGYFQPANGN